MQIINKNRDEIVALCGKHKVTKLFVFIGEAVNRVFRKKKS